MKLLTLRNFYRLVWFCVTTYLVHRGHYWLAALWFFGTLYLDVGYDVRERIRKYENRHMWALLEYHWLVWTTCWIPILILIKVGVIEIEPWEDL